MSHLEIIRPKQVTRWQRLSETLRSFTLGPFSIKDPAIARYFGAAPVSAGVSVNEHTALNYSAVWAAVNLISSHIASVPLNLYKREAGGKEKFDSHALHRLIHSRPNPHMGSFVFRRTLTANALVWGNGCAEIERDQAGRPVALWPLLPGTVDPIIERDGRLRYRVRNPTAPETILEASDMFHLRGPGDDGLWGWGVIQKARESIGLGVAAERFGGSFFGNGSTFGGVISYPPGAGTNPQVRKENRENLEKQHQGVDRAHRFLALYEGAKYERLGVPPNDAQFLETREFQIEEICRWFNLPPHKLKHLKRSTNNNIEHQGIEYVTDTLDPWWVLWEEELTMKLIAPLERSIQFIEHVREGLLRGDQAARGEFYGKLFSIGAITPNEIRARENLNPVTGGDTVYVPLNTLPLNRLDEYIDATLKAKTAPPPAAPPKPDDGDDDEDDDADRAIASLEAQLALAREATQAAEGAKVLALQMRDEAQQQAAELRATLERERDEWAASSAQDVDALGRSRLEQQEAAERHRREIEEFTARERAATLEAEVHRQAAAQAVDREAKIGADLDAALALATQIQAERDTARALAAEAEAKFAAEHECAERFIAERDAAIAETGTLREAIDLRVNECEAVKATLAEVEADRDAARAAVVAAEGERDAERATLAETSAALLRTEADLQSERDRRVAAQEAITLTWEPRTGQLEAEAETLKTDLARARADLASELDRQRAQRGVLLAAMRGLFAEATDRLVTKEVNAARKHQATPEKLRDWMDRFYVVHGDMVRAVFRPLVGPWTAIAGGSPSDLLDELVRTHLKDSERALQLVLECEDDDTRAEALDRTFRRWEEERGDAVADALLREGMAGNG